MGIFDKLFAKKTVEAEPTPVVEPKAPEVPAPAVEPETPKIERVSAADYIHDEVPAKKPRTRRAPVCITTSSGYEYENVGIYRPKNAEIGEMPPVGFCVVFEQDPENPYDNHAVKAIRYDMEGKPYTVGWLNRGKLRDMVWDWIENYEDYEAVVTRADDKLEVKLTLSRE